MLRWLTRMPLYLARQTRNRKPEILPETEEPEDEFVSVYSLRSQYQQVKKQYEQLDQEPSAEDMNSGQLKNTMELLEKMMKDSKMEGFQSPKRKQKIDVKEKFKRIGTPESLLGQSQDFPFTPEDLQQKLNQPQNINSPQMSEYQKFENQLTQKLHKESKMTAEQRQKAQQLQLKLAHQDMLLNELMKNTQVKQLKHLNKNSGIVRQSEPNERERQLMLRQQKIMEAYRNKQDPSVAKYQVTRQDLLRMKYSPQIIEKAKNYRTHQLAYLKELIVQQGQDTEDDVYQLNRRRFLSEEDQSRWNKLKAKPEPVKSISENLYQNIKQQDGLVKLEDTEFYKQKAIKQLKEKEQLSQADKAIMKEMDKDLDLGNEVSDVFLDQAYHEEAKIDRRIQMDDTSFGKEKKKLHELTNRLEKLGIQYQNEDILGLSKLSLFQQKALLEKEQNYQKFLHKKEKKKNMKKQMKQIHREKLKDDVDFDKIAERPMTVKELKQSNNLDMLEDNYEKINEYYQQKKATLVQQTPEQKQSRIHQTKTFKKMHEIVAMYFANGLFNHHHHQLDKIEILQIIPNKSNTVLNVFWNVESKYLEAKGIIPGTDSYQKQFKEIKDNIQKSLEKQSKYLSGKMTRLLRLRYGPEIRFVFDEKTAQTQEAIDQLKKYLKQIAMVQVEEYTKKGLITSEEKQVEYYQKLLQVAKSKLLDYNSRKELLSKKYKKNKNMYDEMIQQQIKKDVPQVDKQVQTKKKRINPIFEDLNEPNEVIKKNSKKRKRNSVEKLWDTIDLL